MFFCLMMREKWVRRGSPYVVVAGRPGRVELHVELSLFPGQLVVLGLFLSGQCVPLETHTQTHKSEKLSHYGELKGKDKMSTPKYQLHLKF